MNQDIQKIIRNILNDGRVELSDEFDRNFERQAFFNEAWQRRSSPHTSWRFHTDRHRQVAAEHQQPNHRQQYHVLLDTALCSHTQRWRRDKGDGEDEAILLAQVP